MCRSVHVEHAAVRGLNQLLATRREIWGQCVQQVLDECQACFFNGNIVMQPHDYITRDRYLKCLVELDIGEVSLDGEVVQLRDVSDRVHTGSWVWARMVA